MHEVHWTKLKLTYLLIVDSWAPLPKKECLQKALLFQYLLPPINHRLHFMKHNNTFPFCCTGKCSLAHLKEKYTLHREYVSFLSLVTFTIEWDLPIVREENHIPDVRYNFSHLSRWYAIIVSIIQYAIRIISCVKSFVSYRRIVSAYESYDTICVSYKLYRIVKLYISYDT